MGKSKSRRKGNKKTGIDEDDRGEVIRDLATEDVTLCCGLLCINCGIYANWDCLGVSGKVGLLCLHCKFCCKPNSYCKQCGCCGPSCQNSGCALCNIQLHGCCIVVSGALPCHKEVPLTLNILGMNLYPLCGGCVTIGEIIQSKKMDRGEKIPQSEPPETRLPPDDVSSNKNNKKKKKKQQTQPPTTTSDDDDDDPDQTTISSESEHSTEQSRERQSTERTTNATTTVASEKQRTKLPTPTPPKVQEATATKEAPIRHHPTEWYSGVWWCNNNVEHRTKVPTTEEVNSKGPHPTDWWTGVW